MKSIARRICVLALAAATAAGAQPFPTRAVTLFIPQPPGGANDHITRSVALKLQETWGKSVVVDYRPGGGVVVGSQAIAKSAPDGHTIGLLTGAHSINAVLRRDLPYDSLQDFATVARVGYLVVALVANAAFPAGDVKSLIAIAKQKPGAVQFGSNGIGTAAHLSGELLKVMTGIELQHIPYNGAAPLYRDMLGERVPIAFAILSSAIQHVKSGKMKVLGITNPRRSQVYPEFPTIGESVPGFEMVTWIGFAVAAATPRDLVQRISVDLLNALRSPEVRQRLVDLGAEPAELNAEEFDAFIRADIEKMRRLIRQSGVRLE